MGLRNHLKASDKYALADLIRKHIIKDGSYWRYKDGWSDSEIAKKFGKGCTTANAASVRRAACGNLAPSGPSERRNKTSFGIQKGIPSHERRIAILEAVVQRLCRELGTAFDG